MRAFDKPNPRGAEYISRWKEHQQRDEWKQAPAERRDGGVEKDGKHLGLRAARTDDGGQPGKSEWVTPVFLLDWGTSVQICPPPSSAQVGLILRFTLAVVWSHSSRSTQPKVWICEVRREQRRLRSEPCWVLKVRTFKPTWRPLCSVFVYMPVEGIRYIVKVTWLHKSHLKDLRHPSQIEHQQLTRDTSFN